MATTTKKDLIDRIAEETNQKRTVVKATVQSFLDNVIRELSDGNRLEFRDFGVFELRDRAPRMAQNPRTLERVPVPAKKTVKFQNPPKKENVKLHNNYLGIDKRHNADDSFCLLYTSPSPRDQRGSRMPSSA